MPALSGFLTGQERQNFLHFYYFFIAHQQTGKVIKYSNWTIGSFSEYNAPEIQGYTPNRNAKAVEVVKHGDHFEPIKITYISLGSDTDDTKTGDYPGNTTGLVGTPINAILDYPMGTKAGYVLFNDPKVNARFRNILNYWGRYLQSEDSTYVLNTSDKGWLSNTALNEMAKEAKGDDFLDLFNCRSNDVKQKLGFRSWDDFFTRTFKNDVRPVVNADDPNVIANACESAPFRIARNVPLKNKFWIKGQPYSLLDLLHNDPWTSKFEGGTIYQAFLSALSYHRWNSPVSGKIVKAYHINGSYYGEALSQGFENPNGAAPVAANDSQAFLTSTATRAVIFIQADNPKIGLMCFVAVGMGDVSNNEITVRIGQHVKKGEQLGMFHFGGSTHVLLFQPTVDLDFNLHGQKPGIDSSNIKVRDEIAVVK